MSETIWVDVRGRSKEDLPQDNSIMLRLKDQLDRLSMKLNVAKLTDFYDYGELEAEYGDLDSAGDLVSGDEDQSRGSWFDSGQALAAVCTLHAHLVQHPEELGFTPAPSQAHWSGQLMEELKHCQAVLEEAVAHGRPFRFLIVP